MAPKPPPQYWHIALTVMAIVHTGKRSEKFLNVCIFSLLCPWLENENQFNTREDLLLYVTHLIEAISY
jgi:hypothetical protein